MPIVCGTGSTGCRGTSLTQLRAYEVVEKKLFWRHLKARTRSGRPVGRYAAIDAFSAGPEPPRVVRRTIRRSASGVAMSHPHSGRIPSIRVAEPMERYLSFAEREKIELLSAPGIGREIAGRHHRSERVDQPPTCRCGLRPIRRLLGIRSITACRINHGPSTCVPRPLEFPGTPANAVWALRRTATMKSDPTKARFSPVSGMS